MGRLAGKTAIITGGAQGMAAAHVKYFVREGAKVVFTDIKEDAGRKLASELNGQENLSGMMSPRLMIGIWS